MKKTIRLTESDLHKIIKNTANSILDESYLYTNDININDLRVSGHWTEDGYAEWEASVDNGWYTFRGTYNGIDCELDEIIEGHSGYGHQHDIDDEAVEWFNQNLADKVKSWLDNDSSVQTESRKRTVKLTESDLHKVITESVKRILREDYSNMALGFESPEGGKDVVVYQLDPRNPESRDRLFQSLDRLKRYGLDFNPRLYKEIYRGTMPVDSLEDVYKILQWKHPKGYNGHSLSVSDLVEMDGRVFFCDSHGFVDVTKQFRR